MPDADDPDGGRLRAHVEACVPGLRVRHAVPTPGGWDSDALVVNGRLLFRFPRGREAEAGRLAKERSLLAELARTCQCACHSLCSPAPATWGAREGPFVGYTLVEGGPLRLRGFTASAPSRAARKMTSFLTSLHRFPVARAVELGAAVATASGWRREYAGLLYRVSERIVPPLPRPLRAAAAGFWVAFLSGDRNFAFRPALVHRDLAREHIRHAADGGAITGVLDWEDASIGDPAIDFAGLDRDLGPRFADEVLAHYGGHVDGAFRGRRAFYAALGPYHEVLFGLDTESRIHVLRVLGSLRRALRSAPCLSSIGDAWTLEWTVRLGCGATSSSVAPWLPVQCAAPAHPLDPGRALRALAGRSGSAGIAVAGPPGRIRSMFAL